MRLIEYIGPRDWVESTVNGSINLMTTPNGGVIRVTTLGSFPEAITSEEVDDLIAAGQVAEIFDQRGSEKR